MTSGTSRQYAGTLLPVTADPVQAGTANPQHARSTHVVALLVWLMAVLWFSTAAKTVVLLLLFPCLLPACRLTRMLGSKSSTLVYTALSALKELVGPPGANQQRQQVFADAGAVQMLCTCLKVQAEHGSIKTQQVGGDVGCNMSVIQQIWLSCKLLLQAAQLCCVISPCFLA
jgi:hypothetical protein